MPRSRASKRRYTADATLAEVLVDPDHATTQQRRLEQLWHDRSLGRALPAVLVLRSGDGEEILAGAEVAAALSRPIQRMVAGSLASVTKEGEVSLPNLEGAVLRAVVKYMYTGRLELTRDTMWGVMSAANYLELGGALGLCASFLVSQMCAENVLDIARAGEEMNCGELRAEALGFVVSHFEEVCGGDSFLELREDEVREILGMDELVVGEEWAVYECLERWVDADASREAIFAELFGDVDVVRLSQMSVEQLESLHASPRAGHEARVKGKVGEESLRRRAGQGAAPSRCRRYWSAQGALDTLPTTCERTLEFVDENLNENMNEDENENCVTAVVPFLGDKVISGSGAGTIKVWRSATSFACERTLEVGDEVYSLLVWEDMVFAGLSNDGDIQVISTTSWTVERTLEGHEHGVWSLVMCGSLLVSGSNDETIRVWSTATWTCERTLEGHTEGVHALTTVGDKLVSGAAAPFTPDLTIKVWDTTSWACERTLTEHTDSIWALASTPDGGKVFSVSGDNTVKVWDTTTWECERTLEYNGSNPYSVLVSGSTLVVGCRDGRIVMKSWATGEDEGTLEGHGSPVCGLVARGGKLLSCSYDMIKVWA